MKNILWTALAILFVSCSNLTTEKRIILDNPTDKEISFKIDDKDYTLPANGQEKVDLNEGKHQLKVNGETIDFETKEYSGGSIINPTNSEYVIFTEYYTDKELSPMITRQFKDVKINGKEYYGPIQVVKGYFLEKASSETNWDKNLDEKFEETIYQKDQGQTSFQIGISKVFRISDFDKYYEELLKETE